MPPDELRHFLSRKIQPMHPYYIKAGYGTWLVLLVLATVFYQERAFFMDGGFQLFNLINEGSIQVYHYRFVTAVPQLLPWLLMQVKAPLWLLALSYSLAYIVFYFTAWHLLIAKANNSRMAWVLLALFTFLSFDTFYHIQSEFYLGLTLLLLGFGMVLHRPGLHSWKHWAVLLPLLVTVGFSHKLALIFFLFLWIFFGWSEPALRHWRYWLLLACMLAVSAVKSVWFTNWYEAAKQTDFQSNWQAYFPKFHTLPANGIFIENCLQHYYLFPVLLLLITVFYLRKMEWRKLALVWSFATGYLLLYNISDPQAPYRFYSEVSYLPLSIFVTIPLFFDLAPAWERSRSFSMNRRPAMSLFTAVLLLRLFTIAEGHRPFERQFNWIAQQLQKGATAGTNRLLLPAAQAPADTVIMDWGVPFTAMHLSAQAHPDSAATLLILPDFERYRDVLTQDTFFLSPFKAIPLRNLNEHYYRLSPGLYRRY